jgi:hypothetical protein
MKPCVAASIDAVPASIRKVHTATKSCPSTTLQKT